MANYEMSLDVEESQTSDVSTTPFPLLDLPVEIINQVLAYLDWPTLLNLICAGRAITQTVISSDGILALRDGIRDQLAREETAEREAAGVKFFPGSGTGFWTEHPRELWGRHDDYTSTLACYTCLRWRDKHHFSNHMTCGSRALGQRARMVRRCIPCGVRTAFYLPGSRASARVGVCETCRAMMNTVSGAHMDEDLEIITESANIGPRIRDFYWWDLSHMCVPCWHRRSARPQETPPWDALGQQRLKKHLERYEKAMLAAVKARRENGQRIRIQNGFPEPSGLSDLEARARQARPFPNYKSSAYIVHDIKITGSGSEEDLE